MAGALKGKPHASRRRRLVRVRPSIPELAMFGDRLKGLRMGRGFTQAALAKAAGISAPHYNNIERTCADPGLTVLLRLAEALDVPIASLLCEDMQYAIYAS